MVERNLAQQKLPNESGEGRPATPVQWVRYIPERLRLDMMFDRRKKKVVVLSHHYLDSLPALNFY
jgi:hypothetical protein